MPEPSDILDIAFQTASETPTDPTSEVTKQVEFVCRNQNRAGTRLLMACLLAKVHNPEVDIRKPYTKIGDDDAYSGRSYDEKYIEPFHCPACLALQLNNSFSNAGTTKQGHRSHPWNQLRGTTARTL